MIVKPIRRIARNGPLSISRSRRPPLDPQAEATPTDRGRSGVMLRDHIGSLLLQGLTPMLIAPSAGVGGVDSDYRDSASSRHSDQTSTKLASRDPGDDASEMFPARAASQRFAAGKTGVSEVEVLYRYRCA